MSVIYKAEIKFPATETSRDILLERQFSPLKQDGIQLLLLPYIPHRNSNSVFGYNNRMLHANYAAQIEGYCSLLGEYGKKLRLYVPCLRLILSG